MNSGNIRKYTIIISLILHVVLLILYKPLSTIHLLQAMPAENINEEKPEKRISFELVETPDDARTEKPPEDTNLLSDKNSIARDQYTADDKNSGLPYSNGDLDVKNIEMEFIEQPGNQNEQANIEEFQGEQIDDSENLALESHQSSKFSREALLGKSRSPKQIKRPKYNNEDFNTEEIGGLTFNTYEWDFAPYMFAMKRKVERNIFPPPAFTRMGMIDGETILRFKVMPNGEVRDLEVLKYKGHKSLMETSVQAITNSSRFRPLPADFPENYLEVTARFTYYIQKY